MATLFTCAKRAVLKPAASTLETVRWLGEFLQAITPALTTDTAAPVPKHFHGMNGPTCWPLVGNFWTYLKKENRNRIHEVEAEQHQLYGPIFKEKLGTRYQVHVADPDLIAQVFRSQGRYPNRPPHESWRVCRKDRGEPFGILTAEGEDWMRIRRVLSQRMLKPKLVADFDKDMNSVLTEMVQRLRSLRDTEGETQLVHSLPNELYKWAMESIGTVLFERRMGCLQASISKEVQEFISAIASMMSSSIPLIVGCGLHRYFDTAPWREHKQAWETLLNTVKGFVDDKLAEIMSRIEKGEEFNTDKNEFLTYLLTSKQLSLADIYANVTEVMLGGIDTTSNTLCFALHLLAQHPEVQAQLHAEVKDILGDRIATSDDLKHMSYLKCIVKETLRLYPVVTMNVRILDEDLVIDGYNVPKNTLFVLNHFAACRNESVFERPSEFLPERWDRSKDNKIHPYAALPFGFGVRSCIGRRVAELELYLALARISQQFVVKPFEGAEFKPQLRTVLTPGECVPVRLEDR